MKIEVQVKPLSKKEEVTALPGGIWKVFVKEKPVEGKANEAVCRLLADHFGVSKSRVLLLRGSKSRTKQVEIIGKDRL